MANWLNIFFGREKPTHEELMRAQRNILEEITANIRILQRLRLTRERVNAIEKLRKLRDEIRNQNEQIKSTREFQRRPVFQDPVHDAAMRTSWKMSEAQAIRAKGVLAFEARKIIQKQVRLHALRSRKGTRKQTKRA